MINYPYSYGSAEESNTNTTGKINVTGTATVTAVPDTVTINIGVVTEDENLQKTQKDNAEISNRVINTLTSFNIPKENIRTFNYSIEPKYEFKDGEQIFKGYTVSNILSVKTNDIKNLGAIIDKATASGANRINSIAFSLEDNSIYYNQALNSAVKNAVSKAVSIARTLRVQINETPVKVTEENIPTAFGEPSIMKAVLTTPVMPGQITITARVTALFKYLL